MNIFTAVTATSTAALLFLATGQQATAEGLDRGGVSVDFRKFQRIDTDAPTQSLTVAMLPFSFIDETYCLASGQVGILHIDGKNTLDRPLKTLHLVLTLPEGVRIVSLRNHNELKSPQIVERDGLKFNEYEIPGTARGYSGSSGNFILLSTDLAPSENRYLAECYLADETFQGPVRKFNIQIIDPVQGKQPKLFETGVHIWNEFSYGDPEALKTLAEQYAGTGFNSIQLGTASSPAMSAAFKAAGLRRYIQTLIVNGYTTYIGKKLPEADKYRGVDLEQVGRAVCPIAITSKGQYFTEALAPALRKIIVEDDLADGLMCNWEPYMFENNGCFCDKCKAEFIDYANVPPAEVEAAWPQQVTRKYASVWPRFRSWQHARLVLTLEETIADLGREVGKQSHFIPEISNRFKRGEWLYSQYDPRDYMEQLPIIQPWGPYLFHRFTRPYVYTLGRHLSLYERAVEPIAYLQHAIADPARRPSMIAFPHGFQGSDWVLEPEAIAFDTLCYFIAGWQGSIAYFFPNGYDGRYWRAMAEANTLIADHEEIVFKGLRQTTQDRFHMQPISPLPAIDPLTAPDLDPRLLQGQEYVYGERRLLAIGNFWQRGDVWVHMTPTNLPAKGQFVVREISHDRHLSSPSGNAWWTPAELRQGVDVHVGALRWAFFTIEPWSKDSTYGAKLTTAELTTNLKAVQQELEMNVKEEMAITHVQKQQVQPPDLSTFSPMTLGDATCQLVNHTNNAGQDVVFALPDGHLVVNPANGAKITSWQHKGVEMVTLSEQHGLVRDGFMLPSPPFIDGPYALDTQTQSETDLSITFRKELIADEYGYELDGLTLYKTVTVPATGGGFTVTTKVRNDSDREVTFAFRYHNVPAVVPGGQEMAMWQVSMPGSADQPEIYDMPQGRVEFFRYKQETVADIEKVFQSAKQAAISKPTLTMEWPQSAFHISIDCLSPESLYGFMFWGFSTRGYPHATIEPLYDKVSLSQGQSWSAGMRWTIQTE